MDRKHAIRASRFLSLVLRHDPAAAGIALDAEGWANVDLLLDGCSAKGISLTLEELHDIVATSDKERFALSSDGSRIRANQGHSVEVDLGLNPEEPPVTLYHGTPERFLGSIRRSGLDRGKRHGVHLSPTRDVAERVGRRRGSAVVLEIAAKRAHADGLAFFRSANGVWLTERVPLHYIRFPESP